MSVEALGRIHFVNIGGIGMSGIARILLARGLPVSGSDAAESPTLRALRSLGASVHCGFSAENVAGADTVVVSSATRQTNPELAEARRLGIRVMHRAQALAAVMAGRRGIAVTGTSGKTTTTSMLVAAVRACGTDPSFAIGGELAESGGNAHEGAGDLFIAEADESDGSFLSLAPYGAIVTNVEVDHLDQHGTPEAYARSFAEFARRIDPAGFLVCCGDDPGCRELARAAGGVAVRTYGEAADADLCLVDVSVTAGGTTYRAVIDGTPWPVRIGVAGRHLALNSAGALLAGVELGLPVDRLIAGLAGYRGVRRRFELRGEAGGVRVYDDYAHHPSKVDAQLRAARVVAGGGRLIVAFQPHLYSRTQAFAEEFGAALALADEVVVLDVYGAREDPVPGVTARLIADAVRLPADRVRYEPCREAVPALLAKLARPGDLVITMGAGDVTELAPLVLRELE